MNLNYYQSSDAIDLNYYVLQVYAERIVMFS